ncbi:hypothetical protein MEG_01231 [Bartonella tamiae Th307]|nr:hypothetical protein MEG_01231 [Bartonella tamiae Th307]
MMLSITGEELGLTTVQSSITDYDLKTSVYCPLTHSSAIFFRNYYNQHDIENLKNYIGTDYEKTIRGDKFRNCWHLNKGKGYYKNVTNTVYEIDHKGIYTGLDEVQKDIIVNFLFYAREYLEKLFSSIF